MIALSRNFTPAYPRRIALFAQGATLLLLGLLYYVLLRAPGAVYGIVVPNFSGLMLSHQALALTANLPSLLHVLAFICMTYAIAGPGKSTLLAACGGWFLVDSGFELAQYDPYARWIVAHAPAWFDALPVLDQVRPHFMRGTFDPADLAAIALGAIGAWFWIVRFHPWEERASCNRLVHTA